MELARRSCRGHRLKFSRHDYDASLADHHEALESGYHRQLVSQDSCGRLPGPMPLEDVLEQRECEADQAHQRIVTRGVDRPGVRIEPVAQVVGIDKAVDEATDLILNLTRERHRVAP